MENFNSDKAGVMLSLRANIEKLGYEMQGSTWDRTDLSRMTMKWMPLPEFCEGYQFERVINDQDVWQIYLGKNKLEIVHAYKGNRKLMWSVPKGETASPPQPIMEFERLFYGEINNENELIKVMEQVGCPFARNGA
jgi:hypothetical protein